MKKLTVTQKKWLLSAHILCTIAWLGPACCYLVVAILAVTTLDSSLTNAAFTLFRLLDQTLVLPAALGTLVTGVLLSIMTSWGLTQWYWILLKTVATPICILLETFGLVPFMERAAAGGVPHQQLIGAFAGHLAVMLALVVVSVLKPWGRRLATTGASAAEGRAKLPAPRFTSAAGSSQSTDGRRPPAAPRGS